VLLLVGKEGAWCSRVGKLTSEDVNPGVPAACRVGRKDRGVKEEREMNMADGKQTIINTD